MRFLLIVFSLSFSQVGLFAQPFVQQLVSIDYENNGALELLATIPNSIWPDREYTFDPVNNVYYFTAQASGTNDFALFSVDLDDGAVSERAIASFNNAQGQPTFEFDPAEELVYTIIPGTGIDDPVQLANFSISTGNYSVIESISGFLDWNSLHSTLNPSSNTYYLSTFFDRKILSCSTVDGSIITETNYDSNISLRHIDYNVDQDKMVGLAKYDTDQLVSLVDIDPVTLEFSNPRIIDGLKNTIANLTPGAGTIAYDHENELYHVIGFNTQNETKLFTIDAKTAEVLYINDYQNPPTDPYFMERHAPEKLIYDPNGNQLLALIRLELLPSSYTLVKRGDLELFPNPISSELNVTWEEDSPEQIQIVDVMGRERLSVEHSNNGKNIQLDVSNLSAGNYYLIMHFKGERYWYKQFSKM